MKFYTETIRMFFAVGALLLVGLLSTPNLMPNSAPHELERTSKSAQAESIRQESLKELATQHMETIKESNARKKLKKKAASQRHRKFTRKIVVLKKS